ncbi:rhodanese-like domain-containing protein [Glaciecola sp. MH2013]|nr:rhodanese-like domain-containing protein [Glaciecola sp. MH2013]
MNYENVSVAQVKQWVDSGEAELVDVREPAEFANHHIEGATLLPLGKIAANDLPANDKKVVIYCQKGARGNSACMKLTKENESITVYNLMGGIEAWSKEGHAVKKGQSSVLPLDRQVQLTIGLSVLAGSALAYFVNPAFIAIPAFFGAGLTFAGASGTCGLALLMAKMPWNQ